MAYGCSHDKALFPTLALARFGLHQVAQASSEGTPHQDSRHEQARCEGHHQDAARDCGTTRECGTTRACKGIVGTMRSAAGRPNRIGQSESITAHGELNSTKEGSGHLGCQQAGREGRREGGGMRPGYAPPKVISVRKNICRRATMAMGSGYTTTAMEGACCTMMWHGSNSADRRYACAIDGALITVLGHPNPRHTATPIANRTEVLNCFASRIMSLIACEDSPTLSCSTLHHTTPHCITLHHTAS